MKPTISISISFLGWLICWHISFAFRGADNYVPGNFICLLHKSKNFHHLTRCYKHSHTLPYCLKCSNKSRANDIIPRPAKLLLFVTFLFEVLLFFFNVGKVFCTNCCRVFVQTNNGHSSKWFIYFYCQTRASSKHENKNVNEAAWKNNS